MKTFTVIKREEHTIEYTVEAESIADLIAGRGAWEYKDTIETKHLETTMIELKDER